MILSPPLVIRILTALVVNGLSTSGPQRKALHSCSRVGVFVYLFVYVSICARACVYVCVNVYVYVYVFARQRVCVHAY